MPYSGADCLLMQKTKRWLDASSPNTLAQQSRRLGWSTQATSAKLTAADKASGGCVVSARRGIGIYQHNIVNEAVEHRLCFAWIGGIIRGGMHCGSIWLKDSEGLSQTNQSILVEAAASIGRLRGPWVLGGDWNMTPQVLASSDWLAVVWKES